MIRDFALISHLGENIRISSFRGQSNLVLVFPLDRIAEVLEEGVSADSLRGMLLLRRMEQKKQLDEERDRLHRLEALLHLIDLEGDMTADVILKDVPAQWIVSLRENIPTYRAVGQLIGKLYGSIQTLRAQGAGVVLLHDSEYKDKDVDAEAGVYIGEPTKVDEPLHCYKLPPVIVASVAHHGAFNRIAEAYASLLRWVEVNRYRPSGPTREIFLHVNTPVTRDDESNVIEIQVPVQRIKESGGTDPE